MSIASVQLRARPAACHGRCPDLLAERDCWQAPTQVVKCDALARAGYDSLDASEYTDVAEVFAAKVNYLADLIQRSRNCIVYSGAGLSTSAGIQDYASQSDRSLSGSGGDASSFRSPMCAQPTAAHRVLVALYRSGKLKRWINQNHDGLPQKAGLPQEAINEIHGAWYSPDNPVIPMTGCLRDDLFDDLQRCEREADLVIALGTSLCGMNADQVVVGPSKRALQDDGKTLGSVIISLQQTVHDEASTLRLFGRCDDVLLALAERLGLHVEEPPIATYYMPEFLLGKSEDEYIVHSAPYDLSGKRCGDGTTSTWDLREGSDLVITGGMHAGAVGEVDGLDREGNVKCRFKLKPKSGKLRAWVPLVVGRWWLEGASKGTVDRLPVVNVPGPPSARGEVLEDDGAAALQQLIDAYAAPN